ncbi:hypothetical protein B0T21DRAFT_454299 [Apiosordaria backusii]|uniref:Uncharacterized protein n=1 Tax=Apiosordaria backusii TaxID=314023 RepID=A0AA40AIL6_9PEZI|nr:hypothetical protein B0T21DRAFT_454299 [Apiosordaria backusii]
MGDASFSDTDSTWGSFNEDESGDCLYREVLELAIEDYYDDSLPRAPGMDHDDSESHIGSEDHEEVPDTADPLRNSGISEEQIASEVLGKFQAMDKAGLNAIQMAEKITSKILQLSDVVFSNVLPASVERVIRRRIDNHGLDKAIPKQMTRDIGDLPFVQAIALLHVCISPASMDIPGTYFICVRAVNTLVHVLRSKVVPGDVAEIIERTWDISVLLLGATRTRAQLVGDNHLALEDLCFLHADHYREEVKKAMATTLNDGNVCRRTLAHLTREELPPFVRPNELLQELEGLDTVRDQFHIQCREDHCVPDVDGNQKPHYHAPGCSGDCPTIAPPSTSLAQFNSILVKQRRMPAVRAFAYQDKKRWWVPVTRKTMAVSHLWRDGISGTRDGGMHKCLHHLFSQTAQEQGLDSYWIDCATIPENPRQRRLMIQQINSTFSTASFTLCMDERIAKLDFPSGASTGGCETHERELLAIITSFWHRRAWTLLEGHKSAEIRFYRESGDHIDLRQSLQRILIDEVDETALWVQACLAELEAYMTDGLAAEAAGLLLVTRKASRPGDAELIWRLLTQPYTTRVASKALNPTPFHHSDTVDLAFLCSNAERSTEPGLCWMPAEASTTAWARKACGGQRAEIVRTTTTHLRCRWYVSFGKAPDIADIDFDAGISHRRSTEHLRWKLESRAVEFLFAFPVFTSDQGRPEECDRVIVLTRPVRTGFTSDRETGEPLWHWETMVKLKTKRRFTNENIQMLNLGFDEQAASLVTPDCDVDASLDSEISTVPQPKLRLCGATATHNTAVSGSSVIAWALVVALFFVCFVAASTTGDAASDTTWASLPATIPAFVCEWAALVPLTVYLASGRGDFELAGEISLRGQLPVTVIPKLWALGGVAKVLRQWEAFFDSANASGETLKIFDIQHGNSFQCYNNAAVSLVADNAMRRGLIGSGDITPEHLERWIHEHRASLEAGFEVSALDDLAESGGFKALVENRRTYGRRQVLNIINVVPVEEDRARMRVESWDRGKASLYAELITSVALAGFLCSLGCIGSAVLLFTGSISRFLVRQIVVPRPLRYLENRESYMGCMLAAVHDNAAIWTLYLGDRGVIDSLLNKPLVGHLESTPTTRFACWWLQLAELLQIIAMTFVAGEKGLDALVLLGLVLAIAGFSNLYGYNMHARNWLRREGYETLAFRCEFPGRTELVAAVQLLSTERRVSWMDSIISPCDRREVLLQRLGQIDCKLEEGRRLFKSLKGHDKTWVAANWLQAKAGASLIEERLRMYAKTKSG